MKYSRTPYDDFWDEIVMLLLKKCCVINPLNTYSQYKKFSCWHQGIICDLIFKKWRVSINAPVKAVFTRTDTGEEIDINQYFKTDDQLMKALDTKLIECQKDNYYQYWIFDDKGTFLGGDVLEFNDLFLVLKNDSEMMCDKLREAYFNAHPEEVARKKAKIKWEYDLPEMRVIKDPEIIAKEKAEKEERARKRAEAKKRKAEAEAARVKALS